MKKLFITLFAISLCLVAAALASRNNTWLKTGKVDLVTMNSARCFFSLAGDRMIDAGVCLNLKGSPVITSKINILLSVPPVVLNSVKPKQFYVEVESLSWNTRYYIRAYVKNKDGTIVYGNQRTFKTLPKP